MPTDMDEKIRVKPRRLSPKECLAAAFLSMITSGCMAPLGAGAAGASGSALGAATGAAPAQPATLWSFLGLSKAQKAACLQQICQNPLLGPATNAMLAPMTLMTGGLFSGLCPPSSAFGAGGSPAQQVASAVAADEASAKERVAAVEYLATVDCHYWPDVEEAIIASLRTDRNECVRYAAAKALISGCCCGKKTIEALTIVVNRTDKDGNPSENSDRVVAAACMALQRCLAVYCKETQLVPEELPEALPEESNGREPATASGDAMNGFATELARLPGPLPLDVTKKASESLAITIPPKIRSYYRIKLASKPREDVIIESFETLRLAVATKYWLGTSTMPPGSQSVASIVEKAVTIMPSGVKPFTRDQVLTSPPPFSGPSPNSGSTLPALPMFEQPVQQAPLVEPEPQPVEPQTVKIPKFAVEPIFLTNPSSSEIKPPSP